MHANVVWAKTHYNGPKWAIESPFLDTMSNVF
jgi:hypothetical protein